MAVSPNRYDHDECHGPALREQQRLANTLAETKPLPTSEEIGDLFASQAKRDKSSPIQTIANQNPWRDELPPEEILNHMADSLEVEDSNMVHELFQVAPIAAVDRSDRLGEDLAITDRIAEKGAADAPEQLKEVVEAVTIAERERARDEWEDARSEVSELLDSDLDL